MTDSTTRRSGHSAVAETGVARPDLQAGRRSRSASDISGAVVPSLLFLGAAAGYWLVYRHQDALPIGIGSNLYPAERMLKGEIVYRDFFMIQTPGILFLNLWLFKLMGVSLLTALKGVLLFKALTVAMTFVVARQVVTWRMALVPAVLTFVWLAPGGPFRPAPIQHETLFVLIAVYFVLRWMNGARLVDAFLAGLSVGLVAMFKQNTGLYCVIALVFSLSSNARGIPDSVRQAPRWSFEGAKANGRALGAALAGVAAPCLVLLVYVTAHGALWAMIDNLLIGPLAHGRERFTGYPLPKHVLIVGLAITAALAVAAWLEKSAPRARPTALLFGASAVGACAFMAPSSWVDNSLYWFQPALFLFAAMFWLRSREAVITDNRRGILLVLLVFSIASFMESFPRSVRGLIIGSLPVAFVLLSFLLSRDPGAVKRDAAPTEIQPGKAGWRAALASQSRFAFVIVSILLFVFAHRLILPRLVHASGALSFRVRAETELTFDRGRGVLFPKKDAAEIDSTVAYIRERVPADGYFFAHSLPAITYYFIAGRNSPTRAMGWNEAGTTDEERVRTLANLRQQEVRLVMTNEQAMKNEHYKPLIDYFANDFHESARIGKTIFLERNY